MEKDGVPERRREATFPTTERGGKGDLVPSTSQGKNERLDAGRSIEKGT